MGFDVKSKTDYARTLLAAHEQLETARDITGEQVPQPKGKRETLDARGAQVKKVALAAGFDAPELKELSQKLHLDTMAVSDPVLAAAYQELFGAQAGASQDGADATPQAQKTGAIRAYLALAGESLAEEELAPLREMDEVLSPEQRELVYAARQRDFDLLGQQGMTTGQKVSALGQFLVPHIPTLALAGVGQAGLLAGPLLTLSLIATSAAGATAGNYMQAEMRRSKNLSYGVNRLSDGGVDNELLRLYRRVAEPPPAEAKALRGRLEADVTLFETLLKLHGRARAASGGEPSAVEQTTLAAFRRYGDALRTASIAFDQGGPAAALAKLEGERAAFLAAVPEGVLDQLKAGVQPSTLMTEPEARAARNALCTMIVTAGLRATCPPLVQHIQRLEAAVDAPAHLETQDARRLTAAEVEGLKVLVGEAPSPLEVLALSRLAHSGALDLTVLWPGFQVSFTGPSGEFDVGSASAALAAVAQAETSLWGKMASKVNPKIVGTIASLLAVTGILTLTDHGFFPWGLGVMMYAQFAGTNAAEKLKQEALTEQVTRHFDGAHGKAVGSEYEVLLQRYAGNEWKAPGPNESQSQRLRREASVIRMLVENAAGATLSLPGELAQKRLQGEQPIYGALLGFAQRLEAAALEEDPARQESLAKAVAALRSPAVLKAAVKDVMVKSTTNDVVTAPIARYVVAKQQLLAQIMGLVQAAGDEPVTVANRGLYHAANAAQNLRREIFVTESDGLLAKLANKVRAKKPQATPTDALDELIAKIVDKPFEKVDETALRMVAARAPELAAGLEQLLRDRWPIDEKHAVAVAGQFLALLKTRIAPVAAVPWPAEPSVAKGEARPVWRGSSLDMPGGLPAALQGALVVQAGAAGGDGSPQRPFGSLAEAFAAAPAGAVIVLGPGEYEPMKDMRADVQLVGVQPGFRVEAGIEGAKGSRLSLVVDAQGMVDPATVELDWGEAVAKGVAQAVLGGKKPKLELEGRTDAGDYVFAGAGRRITVTPDGFVEA